MDDAECSARRAKLSAQKLEQRPVGAIVDRGCSHPHFERVTVPSGKRARACVRLHVQCEEQAATVRGRSRPCRQKIAHRTGVAR